MANAVKNAPKKSAKKSVIEQILTGIMITIAMFKEQFRYVAKAGTFLVEVANVSSELPVLDADGNQVFSTRPGSEGQPLFKKIINLRAVTLDNADEVRELFAEEDAVDLALLNGLTLSANTQPYLQGQCQQTIPMKGEQIRVNVGYAVAGARSKHEEGKKILAVTGWEVMPTIEAPAFSFDDLEITSEESEHPE